MRRKTKKTSAKRTIMILAGAIVLLAILIVGVRFYRSEPLIGPESPEAAARRISPENAYYGLAKLTTSLPTIPPPHRPSVLDAQRGGLGPSVIASRLAIRLSDDHPKVLEYLEQTRPAAEESTRILDTQSFYWAPIDSLQANRENLAALDALSRILSGHALYAAKQGRPEDAIRFALAALRLGNQVACDGPFENALKGCDMIKDAAGSAMCLPWADYSSEQGRGFLSALEQLAPASLDLSATVDWELRLIETGVYTTAEEGSSGGLAKNLQEAALRRFARKQEAMLREAATMSYAELTAWRRRHHRARAIERRALPTRFTSFAADVVERKTLAETYLEGLRAVVALELYRQAHGAYPESLESLVPEYVDSVPVDGYAAEPFRYSRKDDSYQLYSVSHVAGDDGGDPKRDLPLPPLTAVAFKASLTPPDE